MRDEQERNLAADTVLRARWPDVLALGLLCGWFTALNLRCLEQWWLWDDLQLLRGASGSLTKLFLDPASWRLQSASSFVPMVFASYKLDLLLFGFDPRGFYAHALVVGAACIVAIYLLVRTYATTALSLITTATVIAAPASHMVFTLLMDRHYVEGLLFSIVAFYLLSRNRVTSAACFMGALLYFVACLEKEVFIPLPALLWIQLWFEKGRPETRWRVLMAPVAAGFTAVIYRVWMLGGIGGYGSAPTFGALLLRPWQIWKRIVGLSSWGIPAALLLLCFAAPLLLSRFPRWRVVLAMSVLVLVVTLPLLPLEIVDDRYVFVATVLVLVSLAVGISTSTTRLGAVLMLAVCLPLVFLGLTRRAEGAAQNARMQLEGKYVWTSPADAKTLFVTSNGWYVDGVKWLRRYRKGDSSPETAASMQYLVASATPLTSLVQVRDGAYGRLDVPFRRRFGLVAQSFDRQQEIRGWMERKGATVFYHFEPSQSSDRWFLVASSSHELIEVPFEGRLRVPNHFRAPSYSDLAASRPLAVVRESDGRWTISSEFELPTDGARTLMGRNNGTDPPVRPLAGVDNSRHHE